MRMLSNLDVYWCDTKLSVARRHLNDCIIAMKGKYGTQDVVRNMRWAIRDIDQALSDDPKFDLLNGFRNPPNTPKSRRLGWHKKGEMK